MRFSYKSRNMELFEFSLEGEFNWTLKARNTGSMDAYMNSGYCPETNLSVLIDYKTPKNGGYIIDDKNYEINKFTFSNTEVAYNYRKNNIIYFTPYSSQLTGMEVRTFDLATLSGRSSLINLELTIQVPDSYEVYSYSIIDKDVATFKGLRYTDGKIVNCKVKGSEVAVLNETANESYTVLTKLN